MNKKGDRKNEKKGRNEKGVLKNIDKCYEMAKHSPNCIFVSPCKFKMYKYI